MINVRKSNVISSHGFEEDRLQFRYAKKKHSVAQFTKCCSGNMPQSGRMVSRARLRVKGQTGPPFVLRNEATRWKKKLLLHRLFFMGESCFVVISKFYRRGRAYIMKLPLVRNSSSGRNFRGWRYCERRVAGSIGNFDGVTEYFCWLYRYYTIY